MKLGKCIGQGRMACIYEYGNDVIKLFHYGLSMGSEAENTRIINDLGIPSPKFIDKVEIDGCEGIVFEKIKGETMLKVIESSVESITKNAKILAKLHVAINSKKVNYPPNLKIELEKLISLTKLNKELKENIINDLNILPDNNEICHLDFHPDNIILSDKGPIIIDWANVMVGNSLADVARTSILIASTAVPPGDIPSWLNNRDNRLLFQNIYLEEYFTLSNKSIDDLKPWFKPIAAARLLENIPNEEEYLMDIINN